MSYDSIPTPAVQPPAVDSVPVHHAAPDTDTIRAAAHELRSRGFAVCRINAQKKRPINVGWSRRSAEPDEFRPGEQLGIQSGWLSDGNRPGHALVCIDLDSAAAVARADEFLPETGMIDGRPGKPRSHRWFLIPTDTIPPDRIGTKSADSDSNAAAGVAGKHRGPAREPFSRPDGMIVEFRGSGGQAVVPPSLHRNDKTGEIQLRVWEGGSPGEPAVIDYPTLMGRVEQLAEACGWERPVAKPVARSKADRPVTAEASQPAGIDPALKRAATADTKGTAHEEELVRWYTQDYRGFVASRINEFGLPRTSATGYGGGDPFTFELVAFGIVNLALSRRVVWDVFQEMVNFPLKSVADANGNIVNDSWPDDELNRLFDSAEAKAATSPERGNRHLRPTPFNSRPTTPPFPVGIFPQWAEEFVTAQSVELQVPFDLIALLVLGAASAGIARKVTVSPWEGWSHEPTNLFVMCCLPPGERKSQSFGKVFAAVHHLERGKRKEVEPRVKAKESDLRVAQKRVKKLEDVLAKSVKDEDLPALSNALNDARLQEQAIVVPAMPVLRVDDDTPEMLAKELVLQDGRLLVASPEARCVENISRYSDQPNFDVYLKGHAGDDLRSGRIGRGRDTVERPALTCVLTPQPSVLREMGETPTLRDRGFVARWVYSLPMSRVGFRDDQPPPVPVEVRIIFDATLQLLWGVTYADADRQHPHELRFTPEAVAVLRGFERLKESHLRPGGRLADMAGWGNKLGGLCVRLCGIIHAMEGVPNGDDWLTTPIPLSVVERAIKLCWEYLLPHAEAAFGELGESPDTPIARRMLKWLRSRKNPTAEFSKRDAFDKLRNKTTVRKAEDVDRVLRLLEEHRHIRRKAVPAGQPGRPSEVYEVHPEAFDTGSGS